MDNLLREIYRTVVINEENTYKTEMKINDTIEEFLNQYKKQFSDEEIETIHEIIYVSVTVSGEENFLLGVKYAFKLLEEIFVS